MCIESDSFLNRTGIGVLHPASGKAQASVLLAILIAGGSCAFIADMPKEGLQSSHLCRRGKDRATAIYLANRFFHGCCPGLYSSGVSNYRIE